MDVNTIAKTQVGLASSAYQMGAAKKTDEAKLTGETKEAEKNTAGAAFDVNISKEARAAQEAEDTGSAAKTKGKGLDADAVQALQQDVQQKSLQFMIDLMSANNNKLKEWVDKGIGKLNFGGLKIDTSRFALPEVATTPEEAKKAISEGGEWSVNAVSDRITGLAFALAGDDPDKLEEMRGAVEKGFQQAGISFNKVYGTNKMPQITDDTHTEIMNRFDKRAEELRGGAQKTTGAAVE